MTKQTLEFCQHVLACLHEPQSRVLPKEKRVENLSTLSHFTYCTWSPSDGVTVLPAPPDLRAGVTGSLAGQHHALTLGHDQVTAC